MEPGSRCFIEKQSVGVRKEEKMGERGLVLSRGKKKTREEQQKTRAK
jgi:hypothetical protein